MLCLGKGEAGVFSLFFFLKLFLDANVFILVGYKCFQGALYLHQLLSIFLAAGLSTKVLPIGNVQLVLVDAYGGHHSFISPCCLQRVVKVVVK